MKTLGILVGVLLGLVIATPMIAFEREGRIVNGEDAEEGEFPFMASLRTDIAGLIDANFCGGAILNQRFILTASHCLDPDISFEKMSIFLGSVKQSGNGVRYYPEKWILHELWDKFMPLVHDVGLVKTTLPIEFTDLIQPIALYTSEIIGGLFPVTAMGWGRVRSGPPPPEFPPPEGEFPDNLQKLSVVTIDYERCKEMMPGYEVTFDLEQICIMNGRTNHSICNVDSGSPVIYKDKVIGVVSWTSSACFGTAPDMLGSVPYHQEWIQTKLITEA